MPNNIDAFFEAVTKQETPENISELMFEGSRKNPNSFEHWFPFLSKCFDTPKSVFIPLTKEWFNWLVSDQYSNDRIEEFGCWLKRMMHEAGADKLAYPLFLKGSCNSNKFSFKSCIIEHADISNYDLGKKALDTFYFGMCGDRFQSGFVFREFIKFDSRPSESIYSGLPLRCEFRSFYDFKERKVVAVFPYWDEKELARVLPYLPLKEREDYAPAAPRMAKTFEANKERVANAVATALCKVPVCPADIPCSDIWSLDFLLDEEDILWFIDAAEGPLSAYWEKVVHST